MKGPIEGDTIPRVLRLVWDDHTSFANRFTVTYTVWGCPGLISAQKLSSNLMVLPRKNVPAVREEYGETPFC